MSAYQKERFGLHGDFREVRELNEAELLSVVGGIERPAASARHRNYRESDRYGSLWSRILRK